MKSLSAALVIIAGLFTVLTSVLFIRHSDSQVVVSALGGGVTLAGFVGWAFSMRREP